MEQKKRKLIYFLMTLLFLNFVTSNTNHSVGSFSQNSMALNHQNHSSTTTGEISAEPTVSGVAAVFAVVAASYVSGVIAGKVSRHVYNYLSGNKKLDFDLINYDENDFSKFDN